MDQSGWAWCQKCQGMYFTGSADQGACPAGGAHDGSASGHYMVDNGADPKAHPHGQSEWSWCHKCQGLFYGPQVAGSRCPSGDAHDGAGSGDYTLDAEADDTPASQQRGWRWCSKCQGLFYAGNNAGVCPAGDGHDGSGSGSYVVTLGDPVQKKILLSATLAPLTFARETILSGLLRQEPVFAPDQESRITADGTSVISDQNGAQWCQLGSWVGFATHATSAVWQCRSTQFTVTLPAVVPNTQVLPFSAGSPVASLALADGSLPLTPIVDESGLRLIASFGPDPAGRTAYDATIGALSTPGGARVSLSNSHVFTVQDPPAQTSPTQDPPENERFSGGREFTFADVNRRLFDVSPKFAAESSVVAPRTATGSAAQKDQPWSTSVQQMNADSVASSPCAKLSTPVARWMSTIASASEP